jgi:divalent metal cation (Fe/Co/Zn/Cd) transporter
LFAGAVLIWRFWKEKDDKEGKKEKIALRLIGVTFFLLAIFILFNSMLTLFGFFNPPKESLIGIILTILSAFLMTALFFLKIKISKQIGSRSLRAEAYQSLFCDIQDLIVLIGLGLNIIFSWWWADPIIALALIPFLIREGLESFE